MTTPSTERKAGPLLGTGAQTTWPFTFKVFAATDIAVTIADSLGVETALVYGVDFNVTLNANQETSPGGTVTYPISGAALPVGKRLVIFGNLPYDQPLDLPSGGNFSPLALENQLDRLTMQSQQLRERVGRALQVSVTTSADVGLPAPSANELIGWDSTGSNLQNFALSELATAVAYATMRYDTFTGDGAETEFTLTADPVALANLDVAIGGVTQTPGSDYSLVTGVLVFASAPPNGAEILARYGEGLVNVGGDSSDVRFLPAGTGAEERTVQDKLRDTISVKDFGAVGDGVTNDYAAIQAALNYVGSIGGGTVMMENGKNYVVRSSLTMSDDDVTLDMNRATLTVPPLVNVYTIIITGRRNVVENGITENFTAETVVDSRSIECNGRDTIIRNMLMKDYTTGCIYLMDADQRTQVLNCTFSMPTGGYPVVVFGIDSLIDGNNMISTNAGVVCVNSARSCRIVNNKIYYSFEVGIDIIGNSNNPYPPPQNIIIDGNEIINAGNSAIRVGTTGEGGFYGESVVISNNIIKGFAYEGSGYGIDITGKYSGDLNFPPQLKIIITGNLIEGRDTASFGIAVVHTEGISITNNFVSQCTYGIGILEGSKASIVTGNTLTGNRGNGIVIDLQAVENKATTIIANNAIYNNGVSATEQGTGIRIASGRGVRIYQNNIYDRGDGGVRLQKYGVWLQELSAGAVIKENALYGMTTNIVIDAPRVLADYTISSNYNQVGTPI